VNRRAFISLLGGVATWPLSARAQQASTKRPIIAMLSGSSAEVHARYKSGFLQGMREFGYVEGQNFELAVRYAGGLDDRLLPLTEELVRLKPDVIVVGSTAAIRAVKQATATISVATASVVDPIGQGFAASYARPGGQVTGLLWNVDSLPGKQLSFAREIVPRASRVGMLIAGGLSALQREAETAAAALNVELVPVDAQRPADLDAAFETWTRARVDLALMLGGPLIITEHKRIVALAAATHLPALYAWREIVEAGGLMSYGIDLRESFRRMAFYVDRILRGTKPGDLPLELPTKFELVINLKTAKELGLTVSREFQLIADEVIE
jgi:putative ABC transport system substrate-binding protein